MVGVALDAALSFAESMGFLFDDDVVGDDVASREKAVLRWQELIGDGAQTAPADSARGAAEDLFEPDGGELTDPPTGDEYDSEPSAEGADGLRARRLGPPAGGRRRVRRRPRPRARRGPQQVPGAARQRSARRAGGRAPRPSPRGRAPKKRPLGRLRLVKRRPGEAVQDARRAWLLRLLTSF